MYHGRFQLGDEVPIGVQCVGANQLPREPDAAPTMRVYNEAATKVLTDVKIPPKDRTSAAGLHEHFIRLGSDFAVGSYTIRYAWSIGLFEGVEVDHFEVIPGGSADGTVNALHFYDAGHSQFLVHQTDAGILRAGKNPRV